MNASPSSSSSSSSSSFVLPLHHPRYSLVCRNERDDHGANECYLRVKKKKKKNSKETTKNKKSERWRGAASSETGNPHELCLKEEGDGCLFYEAPPEKALHTAIRSGCLLGGLGRDKDFACRVLLLQLLVGGGGMMWIDDDGWISRVHHDSDSDSDSDNGSDGDGDGDGDSGNDSHSDNGSHSRADDGDRAQCRLPPPPPSSRLTATQQWRLGHITNYAYLLMLNHASGRSLNDPNYHPVFPWITTFEEEIADADGLDGCWRKLDVSKFRLNKGDRQLDLQYNAYGHHVTENMSELTFCLYKARRVPILWLKRVVRRDFVSEHYPGNMERM